MARTKGTISQEILNKLLAAGTLTIDGKAGKLWQQVFQRLFDGKSVNKRAIKDAFYYLRKQNLIEGKIQDNQFCIRLTPLGEKEVGKYRLNKIEIKRPKEWDGKWRILIFDVPEARRLKRQALRNKIKELGFRPLQKSVWVIPFPCEKEIKLMREFFELKPEDIRLIEAAKLEGDKFFREVFALKEG